MIPDKMRYFRFRLPDSLYDVSRTSSAEALASFDKRFPPPPLFPPPPPACEEDTNAILRDVIFSNILDTIRNGIEVTQLAQLGFFVIYYWNIYFYFYLSILFIYLFIYLFLFLFIFFFLGGALSSS